MLLVERDSQFSGLCCGICHAPLRPGDRILPSYRQGKPRAIHAHSCAAARGATVAEKHNFAHAA
jgi:hypothetical protein